MQGNDDSLSELSIAPHAEVEMRRPVPVLQASVHEFLINVWSYVRKLGNDASLRVVWSSSPIFLAIAHVSLSVFDGDFLRSHLFSNFERFRCSLANIHLVDIGVCIIILFKYRWWSATLCFMIEGISGELRTVSF